MRRRHKADFQHKKPHLSGFLTKIAHDRDTSHFREALPSCDKYQYTTFYYVCKSNHQKNSKGFSAIS
jgi:hypothetical protein